MQTICDPYVFHMQTETLGHWAALAPLCPFGGRRLPRPAQGGAARMPNDAAARRAIARAVAPVDAGAGVGKGRVASRILRIVRRQRRPGVGDARRMGDGAATGPSPARPCRAIPPRRHARCPRTGREPGVMALASRGASPGRCPDRSRATQGAGSKAMPRRGGPGAQDAPRTFSARRGACAGPSARTACTSPASVPAHPGPADGPCLPHRPRSCLRTIPHGRRPRRRGCGCKDGRGRSGRG